MLCRQRKIFVSVIYISATYKRNATKSPMYDEVMEYKMCCGAVSGALLPNTHAPLKSCRKGWRKKGAVNEENHI